MYHLSIVLRREDGSVLIAQDVDCDQIGGVMAELEDPCLARQRFKDELEQSFAIGVESYSRDRPPRLRSYSQ